jgi:hypothetical protein
MELSPQHLVVIQKSGGEVSPPSTKIRLNDAKPIIHLKRISHLSECQRVRRQEVNVGGVHHRLVLLLVPSTVHEVLRQHPHELIQHG